MSKIKKYTITIQAHRDDDMFTPETILTRDYEVGVRGLDGQVSRDLLKWSIQTDQYGHESIHINGSKPAN